MQKYSLYDAGLEEAMFWFVSQEEEYARFEKANIDDEVSIAEYCSRRFTAFRKYCEDTYGFTVYEPKN